MAMRNTLLLFCALGLFACNREPSAQPAPVKPQSSAAAQPASGVAADSYPLDVCVVSGDKLGSMGEVVTYSHEGREVRFCCKSCIDDFKKEPAKYLAKLDAAKAAKSAPTATN